MKLQFLLLNDGASHHVLGTLIVKGLRKLGVESYCYYPSQKIIELCDKPDYVFCLKPSDKDEELILKFKCKGSKVVWIASDMWLNPDKLKIYDFFVSSSIDWLNWGKQENPNFRGYMVKDEWDYYTYKKHTEKTLNCVTMGYMENLNKNFYPLLPYIRPFVDTITVISGGELELFIKKYPDLKFQHFLNPKFGDADFDKKVIEQFSVFDVGIVVANHSSRSSNRTKAMMYSGIPIVATMTNNHKDLWFNQSGEKILLVEKEEDWKEKLSYLRNPVNRQMIVDHNLPLIKRESGAIEMAKTFLKAIESYEEER